MLFNSYSSIKIDVIDTEITGNIFADDHSLQKCFIAINENISKTIKLLESNLKWLVNGCTKIDQNLIQKKWNTLHSTLGSNATNIKLTKNRRGDKIQHCEISRGL